MNKTWLNMLTMLLLVLISVMIFTGCSGKDRTDKEPSPPPSSDQNEQTRDNEDASDNDTENWKNVSAEIVIKANFSPADFERRYVDIIAQKFPNVTITQLVTSNELNFQNVIASNLQMDIIDSGITNVKEIIDLGIPLALDELVVKHNVDLSRFDPFVVEDVRSYAGQNELLLMPYTIQPFVLNYNKGIFDRFGVEYPQANNTWEELIALARSLSRFENEIHYRGLHAGVGINRLQMQMSLSYADPIANQSLIASDPGWRRLFQMFADIYGVPDNFPQGATITDGVNAFIRDQNLAMFPHLIAIHNTPWIEAYEGGLDLGITTYPVLADNPGVGTGLFGGGLAISSTSKQPELAFEIIRYYISDDVQSQLAVMGLATPLVSSEVRNKLYEGHPLQHLVDIDVLYENQVASPYVKTKWDAEAQGVVQRKLLAFLRNTTDMNTFVRELDEEVALIIQRNP